MQAHTRKSGIVSFTVENKKDVKGLPFHYLCNLSDMTGFVDPIQSVDLWFEGPLTVLGRGKK